MCNGGGSGICVRLLVKCLANSEQTGSYQVEELIRGTDAGLSWKSLTAKLGIEETDNNSVNCLRAHVEELICNGRVYQNGELFMSL